MGEKERRVKSGAIREMAKLWEDLFYENGDSSMVACDQT
jgi:hypothetical protein